MAYVNTARYEAHHGQKPQQPEDQPTTLWAFQIDEEPEPVYRQGRYEQVFVEVRQMATYSVTVLP